jgi:3-hydroxyacyl-CoA dehydrogenase/enoyl-CoA hydratase/3-hydroxybutyryl-CoA epimerase
MIQPTSIRWTRGDDGIVVLTLDDPTQSANTVNDLYLRSMGATLDRLEAERDGIIGVIITSAKQTFFAGGDLHALMRTTREHAEEITALVTTVRSQLRRLETLGRPVVAAIGGAALGGGLEIALACHHRVVLDDPLVRIGFPEVTLGLLPGGGGVVRSVRLLGVTKALSRALLQGQRMRAGEARDAGLVDEIVATREELLEAARRWIAENPEAVQPWDRAGYAIPGGTPATPELAAILPALPAQLTRQFRGTSQPAPHHILCAAVEGAQVDFDTALVIEGRYFIDLACGQIAKNMIKATFLDMQHVNGGASRPKGRPAYVARRVGVVGAGMMGAGIAHVCARAGMEVVLKDVSLETAEKGRKHSEDLLTRAVRKGAIAAEERDRVLARIVPTASAADLAGCDLIVEAVFEDQALKQRVFQEIEAVVGPDTLLASNTSTLPITGLAAALRRSEDFVGLHFFSPVDRMPLVEIIAGRHTSDAALARAFDVVRQIRKTPILVKDSRGFFTSRVILSLLREAAAMLGEGLNPVSIERAATQAGYPVGPLALLDEVTLTLLRTLRDETREALERDGRAHLPHPGEAVLDRMVVEFDRRGRSTGAGFYEYPEHGPKRLWPGLFEHFAPAEKGIPFEDMKERMLFIEALETARCFEEGVIQEVAGANVGSILGIGFPVWTGGTAQYMNQYEGGLAGFATRARDLAARYGDRFTPPALLTEMAGRCGTFEGTISPREMVVAGSEAGRRS